MNKTWAETVVLTQSIVNRSDYDWDDADVVICPATLNLKAAYTVIEYDKAAIAVGAQNVHWDESGPFTGEVSVSMLSDVGATHAIVGHSERREIFSETDEMVNRKAKALLAGGLVPIICVGESLHVRDEGAHLDYICSQVRAALAGMEAREVSECVIAYEPVWAIGTGRTATPEQAQEVCSAIRSSVASSFGQDAADSVRVLYGGSLNTGNVEALVSQPDIDGGLVGGASLEADSFVALVNAVLK